MKTSGEKLRDLRETCGLSQREFGDKIGITRASINAYEQNINPLPDKVKRNLFLNIGLGYEYFDTDMSLEEAIKKFDIDIRDIIKTKADISNTCILYNSMNDFVKGISVKKPFKMQSFFLKYLFHTDFGKKDLCFIKITNLAYIPYAKNGDILVVTRNTKAENNDKIIIDYNGEIMIVKFLKRLNEIQINMAIHHENEGIERQGLTFTKSEFEQNIKILAVIQEKCEIKPIYDTYLNSNPIKLN